MIARYLSQTLVLLLCTAPVAAHEMDARLDALGRFIEGDVLPLETDPLADAEVGEWASYYLTSWSSGEGMGRLTHQVVEVTPQLVVVQITFQPAGTDRPAQVTRHAYPRGAARLQPDVLQALQAQDHTEHDPAGKPPEHGATPHRWVVREAKLEPGVLEDPRGQEHPVRVLRFEAHFEVPYDQQTLNRTLRLNRWFAADVPALGWARVERVTVMQVGSQAPYTEGYVGVLEDWGPQPEPTEPEDG